MGEVATVPESSGAARERGSADDAGTALRRLGGRRLVTGSWRRFRDADGFVFSRALGYQLALALLPLVIAVVGLTAVLDVEGLSRAMQRTVQQLSPGGGADAVGQAVQRGARETGGGGVLALVLGLLGALLALTTAMRHTEKGANRIYGLDTDRPVAEGYRRAALLALFSGLPAALGALLLVAGGAAITGLEREYGLDPGLTTTLDLLRWPVGALLALIAITVLFRRAPHRHQPPMSWLAVGAAIALGLWLALTAALALYVTLSSSFGRIYGPLTGVIALLLWSQLTSAAMVLGLAFCAELEAGDAGAP